MAAWMFVKSGLGVRTSATGFTANETGAFGSGNLIAANCYDSISDAILYNTIAHGDRILCSDLHAKSGSLTAVNENAGTDPGDVVEVFVCSVDDTDVTILKAGASETDTSATNDYKFGGKWVFNGIIHDTGDEVGSAIAGSNLIYDNCSIIFDDRFQISADGQYVEFKDCIIAFDDASSFDGFWIQAGSKLVIKGGQVKGHTTAIDFLAAANGFVGGGASAYLEGVDFTQSPGFSATAVMFPSIGAAGADDAIDLQAYGCKLPTGATWTDEEFTGMDQNLRVFGSGVSDEHTFHIKKRGGTVDHETTTVRSDGDTFPDGSTRVSAKVVTNAATNLPTVYQPFRFQLPVQWNNFSSTGTQTVRLYLTSDKALAIADAFGNCGYNDGSNNTLLNYASSGNVVNGTWTSDPWAAKDITGATQANPVVITAVAHGFSNTNKVAIHDVVGMTEINDRSFTVANVTADTFELQGEDGTGHTAYTSGGTVDIELDDGSAAVWASGKTYEYYIDIDTSGDEGMSDSAMSPVIDIYVTKANVTIYFDTEVDYVA